MTDLTTGQAAKVLQVSPNTLRSWERRFGELGPGRTPGHHRRYRRTLVLALRDAQREGLTGRPMLERATELERSGRYTTPGLAERLERMDVDLHAIRTLLADIVRRLDNAGIVRRNGDPVAGRRSD